MALESEARLFLISSNKPSVKSRSGAAVKVTKEGISLNLKRSQPVTYRGRRVMPEGRAAD